MACERSTQIIKVFLLLFLCIGPTLSGTEEFILGKDNFQLHIVHPDSGYYTGARFESAGFISRLIYQGNDLFGRNYKEKRKPDAADQVCGQAEEFSDPIFLENRGRFLKIGNGIFEMRPEQKYLVNETYTCIRRFSWSSFPIQSGIGFRQTSGNCSGYAYEYTKTIRLLENPPMVEISYILRNTGKKIIETKQYAHNFFALNESIPKGTRLVYSGKLKISPKQPNPPYCQNGSTLTFQNLKKSFSYVNLPSAENHLTIHFPNGVTISCFEDYVPCERGLYTGINHICPESFIPLYLRPGEKKEWRRRYIFSRLGTVTK